MYAGRIAERGPVGLIKCGAAHPYTKLLYESVCRLDTDTRKPLVSIEGLPPVPARLPVGCPFSPRCPSRMARCHEVEPSLLEVPENDSHSAACHLVAIEREGGRS